MGHIHCCGGLRKARTFLLFPQDKYMYAQQSSEGPNLSQTFTRAQIAKMSRKEFEKYEKAIMKQLREGKFK